MPGGEDDASNTASELVVGSSLNCFFLWPGSEADAVGEMSEISRVMLGARGFALSNLTNPKAPKLRNAPSLNCSFTTPDMATSLLGGGPTGSTSRLGVGSAGSAAARHSASSCWRVYSRSSSSDAAGA